MFIEFFAFDSDSLPHFLCVLWGGGMTFPLVALHKIPSQLVSFISNKYVT